MKGVAYSYLRFSTPEQAHGDSRRRQSSLAEDYARRHNLLLDKGLNFRDLGVSAFRGKNAKEGGLRSFLDAVDHGLVPANSYLLVESLDRLSRDQILEAQSLFLQIVTAGVTIVTLLDQRTYSTASLNANPTDLIISLVYMMRANEESATKSIRLRAAWAARRDRPGNVFHGGRCPGWLKPNAARTGYDVIPERAAIIQRIFRESLDGVGLQTIARNLNADGVPLFGHGNQRGKFWQRALIRHSLITDLVIGTYTPCKAELVNGKDRYVPITPRLNYYPPVISVADWEAVRARRLAWSAHHGCQISKLKVANVLSRLGRCPMCDRPMVLQRSATANQRYLTCMTWREARGCSNEWVRFPEVEDALVNDVEFVIAGCPQPVLHVEARRAMLRSLSNRLSHLRARLAREEAVHATLTTIGRNGRSDEVGTRREMEGLLAERRRLRADRSYWEDATLKLKLEALRAAVGAVPRDIARINLAYRSLLLKVVVDWPSARLVLHWRHGGESAAGFWRKRQRGTIRNLSAVDPRWPRPTAALQGIVHFPEGGGGDVAVAYHEALREAGFIGLILTILGRADRPLTAAEVAAELAAEHEAGASSDTALRALSSKVRRAVSRAGVPVSREGSPGIYAWRLADGFSLPGPQ